MTTPETEEVEAQTVEIPLSAHPECKPGDTLTLKVVSVDQDAGTINAAVSYADETEGGSDDMADEFSQEKMEAKNG